MTKGEWRESSSALRKLIRDTDLNLGEELADTRRVKYKFGIAWNPRKKLWCIWNGKTDNVIATIKPIGHRMVVRYRKNSVYAGILSQIKVEGWKMIHVPSNRLGSLREWTRDNLRGAVLRSIQEWERGRREPVPEGMDAEVSWVQAGVTRRHRSYVYATTPLVTSMSTGTLSTPHSEWVDPGEPVGPDLPDDIQPMRYGVEVRDEPNARIPEAVRAAAEEAFRRSTGGSISPQEWTEWERRLREFQRLERNQNVSEETDTIRAGAQRLNQRASAEEGSDTLGNTESDT